MREDILNHPAARAVMEKYGDILSLERPRNGETMRKHPPMSLDNRAKIFSPFAALRGYEQQIAKEGLKHMRVHRPFHTEETGEQLSCQLSRIQKGTEVSLIYFFPDPEEREQEDIGTMLEIKGICRKIDIMEQWIQVDDIKIPFEDLQEIHGTSETEFEDGTDLFTR